MTRFPWARAMALGLGRLGLPPAAFWAMTPRELAAALGPSAPPPARRDFEDLMREFPDD